MKLEIRNLEKIFRTDTVETVALNNVSFTINDGDFVAIMGPSGCGKSTLLNILGLLDNPTSGSYRLDGEEVGALKESARTEWRKGRIGFIFQSFNLIEDMNVRDNIMLPLNNLKLSSEEKNKRVDEALRRMGISHRSRHYPSQLSGGQQQRVAIARAIAHRPQIVLADEPTAELDSAMAAEVARLFQEMTRTEGVTIVMTTHDTGLMDAGDMVIELANGKQIAAEH